MIKKKNPLILINLEWECNSSFIQLICGKFCNILLEKDFSVHIKQKAYRKKQSSKSENNAQKKKKPKNSDPILKHLPKGTA